jgi:hypothetical protein
MIPDHGSAPLVKLCGGDLDARIEESRHQQRVDHVWITMDCGFAPRALISINTWSMRNWEAGFDARVRVGMLRGTCLHFPGRGMEPLKRFDYLDWESSYNIFYEHKEREELESLLVGLCEDAEVLEAWGSMYSRRKNPGLHQIHSRRASCAVVEDLIGIDGGLKFYFRELQEIRWIMVFLKFCGQP